MKNVILPTLLVVSWSAVCLSVDRGNFKTCDQSGFCKRQRATQAGNSPYQVLMDTLAVEPSRLSVQVLNTKNKVALLVEFFALQDNTARLKIDEAKPSKPRYQPPVGDVLVKEPALHRLEVTRHDADGATVVFEDNQVIIQAKPFRIDFISGTEPVISLNAAGLLKFEHLRTKEPADEPPKEDDGAPKADNEEEEEEKQDKDEEAGDNLWEEKFKTHDDSKPNGPTSVGMDISFPGYEFVYGIPEHADTLALKSTKDTDPYRLYNLDVFEYELNNPMALYGSVPFMIAHNEKRTAGVFWLNAAETWIDISSNVADKNMWGKVVDFMTGDQDMPQVETHWFSESGIIDVFFLLGPNADDVFRQYASLTGTTPLPPLFSLGYHQSRWNYNDEQDVAQVDANFDKYDIPLDVIWLDIEHTDGKRYFTWDKHKFPNSEEMIKNVSTKGRKMVTIVDPHIKRDDGYFLHQQGRDKSFYVKNKDGNDYEGWCWPGTSHWLDFLDPQIRTFWSSKFLPSEYQGSTEDLYTWNDMNEPSVFNGPEITMHKDAKHYGGWEHRDIHNLYGLYVHRASVEGQLMRSEQKERHFVLSRAFFAGSQRYGAIWTGDNTGEWGHLKMSLPMVLSMNLVGITFSGADIGGFFKNPDSELLTRWYQAGAYQPFFRAHAHLDTRRREPWLLPEENMKAVRATIRERYCLLPYWYTLFYNAEIKGGPILRPLWLDFPQDKQLFGVEDQYLVGSALLVHPVTDAGATGVNVYLPGSDEVWYDVETYEKFNGGRNTYIDVDIYKIPVFQRGGYIVPRRNRVRRASSLTAHDPFTLIVTLNKAGTARGELYVDDYHTFQYRDGEFVHREFNFNNNELTSKNLNVKGDQLSFTTDAWLEKVVIVGLSKNSNKIVLSIQGSEPMDLVGKYDANNKVLVIRKPGVNIAKDWSITLA